MPPTSQPIDIYVRVSRRGSRERLSSPDEQEHDARAFLDRHGLRAGIVLPHDIDKSGGTLDRPGLQEGLARLRDGKSGGIVVSYLSRAVRHVEYGNVLAREIEAVGGTLFAPNVDRTTADGRMIFNINLAIDAGYRERKGEELERAKKGAIEAGIPVATRPPVGYRQREDRRLEPDPKAAPVVREVFERRAAGAGPAELGALLEREGVTTSQGSKTWSKQAVYNLIANRGYLGELSYGRDRRYVNPDAHEPLADRATWQGAQHPNRRASTRSRAEATPWLLASILRCASCSYSMSGTTTSRGKRIYRCSVLHAGGRCPAPVRIDADTIEHAVVEAFWSVTRDLEAKGQREVAVPDLDALRANLARTERRVAQAMTAAVQDAAGEDWATMIRDRRRERDEAAAELGHAEAEARTAAAPESLGVEKLSAAWERADTAERRDLLALRLDCAVLSKEPRELRVYPVGTAPSDLPRRGYKRAPVLKPFPAPTVVAV